MPPKKRKPRGPSKLRTQTIALLDQLKILLPSLEAPDLPSPKNPAEHLFDLLATKSIGNGALTWVRMAYALELLWSNKKINKLEVNLDDLRGGEENLEKLVEMIEGLLEKDKDLKGKSAEAELYGWVEMLHKAVDEKVNGKPQDETEDEEEEEVDPKSKKKQPRRSSRGKEPPGKGKESLFNSSSDDEEEEEADKTLVEAAQDEEQDELDSEDMPSSAQPSRSNGDDNGKRKTRSNSDDKKKKTNVKSVAVNVKDSKSKASTTAKSKKRTRSESPSPSLRGSSPKSDTMAIKKRRKSGPRDRFQEGTNVLAQVDEGGLHVPAIILDGDDNDYPDFDEAFGEEKEDSYLIVTVPGRSYNWVQPSSIKALKGKGRIPPSLANDKTDQVPLRRYERGLGILADEDLKEKFLQGDDDVYPVDEEKKKGKAAANGRKRSK